MDSATFDALSFPVALGRVPAPGAPQRTQSIDCMELARLTGPPVQLLLAESSPTPDGAQLF